MCSYDLDPQIAKLFKWKSRLRAQLMMSRSVAHHPAWNMRQRSIELMDDKNVSTLETLTPNDNRRLPTSRMKRIMNLPVALIPGSMSLLRAAPAKPTSVWGWVSQPARKASRLVQIKAATRGTDGGSCCRLR
jgi:hypothetical protein